MKMEQDVRSYWHSVQNVVPPRSWFFDLDSTSWVGVYEVGPSKYCAKMFRSGHGIESMPWELPRNLEEAKAVALMLAKMS